MGWRRAIIWTNDGLVYWRIDVSLDLDELNPVNNMAKRRYLGQT